jgi:hypothetical protein
LDAVSRLQQTAKIALAHNCVPGIAIISAMMIRPQVVIDVAQGVRACGGFISVGTVNLLASPSLKHQRFITRAREWLFAGLERRWITATGKNSMTEMRHWFLQIA